MVLVWDRLTPEWKDFLNILHDKIHEDIAESVAHDLYVAHAFRTADPPIDLIDRMESGKVHRISLLVTGKVQVTCLGIERVDSELKESYDSVSQLPTWVQEKLALLQMIDPTPPIAPLNGVGHRISQNTFWVFG